VVFKIKFPILLSMQIKIWDCCIVAFHCSSWKRCFFEREPYKRCVICFVVFWLFVINIDVILMPWILQYRHKLNCWTLFLQLRYVKPVIVDYVKSIQFYFSFTSMKCIPLPAHVMYLCQFCGMTIYVRIMLSVNQTHEQ
jgi:hypothetical protein